MNKRKIQSEAQHTAQTDTNSGMSLFWCSERILELFKLYMGSASLSASCSMPHRRFFVHHITGLVCNFFLLSKEEEDEMLNPFLSEVLAKETSLFPIGDGWHVLLSQRRRHGIWLRGD